MTIVANPVPNSFDVEGTDEEIWCMGPPQRGDHIRVDRGLYCHHGIYVSDEEVIHFTGTDDDSVLDWSKASVIKTDLASFLQDGTVEVKVYTEEELNDLYPVDGIVSYARACVGDGNYNLIFNNCEHFANACALGKYRSHQVERVLGGKLTMGLWDGIKSFFGFGSSSSGGRSSSNYNYNYEPDKVKVAQIEADLKLKLANKELERIELMRDAQKELLEMQTMGQIAIERARTEGMKQRAEQLSALQDKLLDIAQKRIEIIEKGSLPIIGQIEAFYDELGNKIEANNDKYMMEKLPKLLDMLQQYEEGTPQHQIYQNQINDDRTRQNDYVAAQLNQVAARQQIVLQGFINGKESIIAQTGQITQKVAEAYLAEPTVGQLPKADMAALEGSQTKALPGKKIAALQEGEKEE